jgi:hypothetical protein
VNDVLPEISVLKAIKGEWNENKEEWYRDSAQESKGKRLLWISTNQWL